jgi:hypothetical protein
VSVAKDIRRWEPQPDAAAIAEAKGLFERSREIDLRLSRVLARIEAKGAHHVEGAATIADFARRHGFDGLRATELARLGAAVEKAPEIRPKLESGQLTIAAASAVAPLLAKPEMQKPGEDWVKKAEEATSIKDLRRDVKFRVEEARQGAPVTIALSIPVTQETCEKFRRIRRLASAMEKKELSESQTFAKMAEHCLRSWDPLEKKPRARRMGPTEERPTSRGVAAETKRTLANRSGLLCEFPGCTRVATHKAHVKPHAKGSGREPRHLWNGCPFHHAMYDVAKTIRIVGWTADGKPIFVFADGTPVRARPSSSRQPPLGEGPRTRPRRPGDGTEDRATRAPSR